MPETLTIPRRCNGPPDSANGGYTCGLVAERIGHAAAVSLRVPPPLERPLRVEAGGGAVRLLDGETVVAEGSPGDPGLEPPQPPAPSASEGASDAGLERWARGHPFPTCVTCGPERRPGDGLRIFPGELDDSRAFTAPWTPDPALAGPDGAVPIPWLWAALDCPSSAPVTVGQDLPPCVLASLTARTEGVVEAGAAHVVVAWLLGREGRKHHSGSALFTATGELRGIARALWIELREQPAAGAARSGSSYTWSANPPRRRGLRRAR